MDWEMLTRLPKASNTATSSRSPKGHPKMLRQVRWADARPKVGSTQILIS